MSSSFLNRLDQASTSIKAETKDITPTKTRNADSSLDSKRDLSHIHEDCGLSAPAPMRRMETEAEVKARLDAELAEYRAEETLVTQASEYLFDLFDANCLEDFKTMENFETMALDAFKDFESTEISFEQHRLHDEFMELFQTLFSKFLAEKQTTPEAFYELVSAYLSIKEEKADSKDKDKDKDNGAASRQAADEVVDVIFSYTDLSLWCGAMRDRSRMLYKWRARQREQEIAFRKVHLPTTQLEEAREKMIIRSPSKAHRLDSK